MDNEASIGQPVGPASKAAAPADQKTLLEQITAIISILSTIASVALPGATIAGWALTKIIAFAMAVANGIPDAISAFQAIQNAANGEAAPTAEEWAAADAAADTAHLAFQAAIAEELAKVGG